MLYRQFDNTTDKWRTWIVIIADPHAGSRGFTLLGRELPVKGNTTVKTEMLSIIDKRKQYGEFWVIDDKDFIKAVPELTHLSNGSTWLIPKEFANPFVKPAYVEPVFDKNLKF